ncbi:uncharacterized protein METZ01_LOCUS445171, partial [marine metagenome]
VTLSLSYLNFNIMWPCYLWQFKKPNNVDWFPVPVDIQVWAYTMGYISLN